MQEKIIAHGHKNVRSAHKNTIEITKHRELGLNGDCIVAVGADKACADLDEGFKEKLKKDNTILKITIRAGEIEETILARGNKSLLLTHTEDMVIRRSDHVCPRTLAISADKAACDLDRRLVERLMDPEEKAEITLRTEEAADEGEKQLLACLEEENGV